MERRRHGDEVKLKVRLLGPFEIWRQDRLLSPQVWPQHKTLALFKLLVSARGRIFTQDQLIETLFSGFVLKTAAQNLFKRISELRHILEPTLPRRGASRFILSAGAKGYCFNARAPCEVDIERFHVELTLGQEAEKAEQWGRALMFYRQAIGLYRGDFLSEDLYEEWTLSPRRRWREMYVTTFVRQAECNARLGRYTEAIASCIKALETDPRQEIVYWYKMLYHYLSEEPRAALQTYRSCVAALHEHVGEEPSPETQELHQQILQGKISSRISRQYPPASVSVRHNLPAQLTSFIGRECETTQIKQLLASTRLLTLTGPGGSGKTRLARRVAADLIHEFDQGVWWVRLAPLAEPELVAQEIAAVLGLPNESGPSLTHSIPNRLRSGSWLLVLDNCEHLVETCARWSEILLGICPQLKILATSREILRAAGEIVWPVPPLSLPDCTAKSASSQRSFAQRDGVEPEETDLIDYLMSYDAVRLFVERAGSSRVGFRLTTENAKLIIQICRRLDGLPLALELAATRAKVLSLRQIAERLDDCLSLLTESLRTAVPRQQTLQAAFDWSYGLLSVKEQRLWSRLSSFAGGWTLEAAEAVCADGESSQERTEITPAEILGLLTQLANKSLVLIEERKDQLRYYLLEIVRQYGLQKLLESKEDRKIRERHLEYFLSLAEKAKQEKSRGHPKSWLDSLEREHDNLRRALESGQRDRSVSAAALRLAVALDWFWEVRGYWEEGQRWIETLLDQNQEIPECLQAAALSIAGSLAWRGGEHRCAIIFGEKALHLYSKLNDQKGIASAFNILGLASHYQGDYDRAIASYQKSLAISRALDDRRGVASVLNNLGRVIYYQGDQPRSAVLLKESLTLWCELGDPCGKAMALLFLGEVTLAQGHTDRSKALLEEGCTLCQELGDKRGIALALNILGAIARLQKDYDRATIILEESLVLCREIGDKRGLALALNILGVVSSLQGDPTRGVQRIEESLALRDALGDKRGIADCIEDLASTALAQQDPIRVARLLGIADRLRETIGAPLLPYEELEHQQNITHAHSHLGATTFTAIWSEARQMPLAKAIAYALHSDT